MHTFPNYPLAKDALSRYPVKTVMPHRLEPLLHVLGVLFVWSISTIAAVAEILIRNTVWDHAEIRCWCIIGAGGGAVFLGLATASNNPAVHWPRVIIKIFASWLGGILFAPGLMHWREWPVNADSLMLVSAAVAVFCVGALKIGMPIMESALEKFLKWWAGSKIPADEREEMHE